MSERADGTTLTTSFGSVRLIEQVDSAPWRVLQEFTLHEP
jgi:hypothetical protein